MIFDTQSMFSDKQAITATAASTNVIDFGEPMTPKHAKAAITQDIGRGKAIPIRVQVTEDFNTLTSLTVAMQVDSDEAFGSAETVATFTVPLADLEAGYVLPLQFLPTGIKKRYMRLNYTVTGTAPTAGAITAGLVFGNDNWSA